MFSYLTKNGEKSIVKEILYKGIESSYLMEIKLLQTRSNIIQQNRGIIYCSVYKGLKGLFRKDIEETKKFGRVICDTIKEKLKCKGFFTTDELPRYGVSRKETKTILKETNAEKNDLVVIFAYGREEAQRTKDLLDQLLKQARN